MNFELIEVTENHSGQVAVMTLSAAPANILCEKMMLEICQFLESDKANSNRKLIVFKGAGDHFSFGASVEEHTKEQVQKMLPDFHKMIRAVLEHPVATLAQVSGFCLGGGFELALACSFKIACEKAKFAVPEIQLGVFPPVAAALLPVGSSLSCQMIMTGERFSAAQLMDHNVLTMLAPEHELSQTVAFFIEKHFLNKSASSLRFAHQAARLNQVNQFNSVITKLESFYLDELMATHDANEGIESFIAKRKPEWKDA